MKLKFLSKFLDNMTKMEKNACYSFSLSGGEEIFSTENPLQTDKRLRVFLVKVNGRIIGWSTCDFTGTEVRKSKWYGKFDRPLCTSYSCCSGSGRKAYIFVNVRKFYRRKGIGTTLVKKSIKYAHFIKKTAIVYPYDDRSEAFYNNLKKQEKFANANAYNAN